MEWKKHLSSEDVKDMTYEEMKQALKDNEDIILEKFRMKKLYCAIGFGKFIMELCNFMQINNFKQKEIDCVLHLMNSFYMLGDSLDKSEKDGMD